MFIRLTFIQKERAWKAMSIVLGVLTIFVSFLTYQSSPKELSNVTVFDSFYKGVLASSYSIDDDLKEFGVDLKYMNLAGNAYYTNFGFDVSDNNKAFKKDFYDKVSHKEIITFYLKHPYKLYKAMEISSNNAFDLRPVYLGNFEKIPHVKPKQKSEFFSYYNDLRNHIFPKHFIFLIVYFGCYFIVLLYKWIKTKDLLNKVTLEFIASILALAIVQFPISIISEGENELVKHLFLFDGLFDISVLIALLWFVNIVRSRLTLRKIFSIPMNIK